MDSNEICKQIMTKLGQNWLKDFSLASQRSIA